MKEEELVQNGEKRGERHGYNPLCLSLSAVGCSVTFVGDTTAPQPIPTSARYPSTLRPPIFAPLFLSHPHPMHQYVQLPLSANVPPLRSPAPSHALLAPCTHLLSHGHGLLMALVLPLLPLHPALCLAFTTSLVAQNPSMTSLPQNQV